MLRHFLFIGIFLIAKSFIVQPLLRGNGRFGLLLCEKRHSQLLAKGFGKPTVAEKRFIEPENSTCSCGSLLKYESCCGNYHKDLLLLENRDLDPAALVRSRYVAYKNGLSDYLVATTHATQNDYLGRLLLDPARAMKKWKKELLNHFDRIQFFKLVILQVDDPQDIASLEKDHEFPANVDVHSVHFRYFTRQDNSEQITVIDEVSAIVYGPNPGHISYSKEDQNKSRWSYAHSIWRPLESEEELLASIEGDEELQKMFALDDSNTPAEEE